MSDELKHERPNDVVKDHALANDKTLAPPRPRESQIASPTRESRTRKYAAGASVAAAALLITACGGTSEQVDPETAAKTAARVAELHAESADTSRYKAGSASEPNAADRARAEELVYGPQGFNLTNVCGAYLGAGGDMPIADGSGRNMGDPAVQSLFQTNGIYLSVPEWYAVDEVTAEVCVDEPVSVSEPAPEPEGTSEFDHFEEEPELHIGHIVSVSFTAEEEQRLCEDYSREGLVDALIVQDLRDTFQSARDPEEGIEMFVAGMDHYCHERGY